MIYSLVFGMSRTKKRVISLFIDVVLLISAFFLAYWTRLGGIVAFDNTEIWITLLCTIAITLFVDLDIPNINEYIIVTSLKSNLNNYLSYNFQYC